MLRVVTADYAVWVQDEVALNMIELLEATAFVAVRTAIELAALPAQTCAGSASASVPTLDERVLGAEANVRSTDDTAHSKATGVCGQLANCSRALWLTAALVTNTAEQRSRIASTGPANSLTMVDKQQSQSTTWWLPS